MFKEWLGIAKLEEQVAQLALEVERLKKLCSFAGVARRNAIRNQRARRDEDKA